MSLSTPPTALSPRIFSSASVPSSGASAVGKWGLVYGVKGRERLGNDVEGVVMGELGRHEDSVVPDLSTGMMIGFLLEVEVFGL